jgi:transmembrane sensor
MSAPTDPLPPSHDPVEDSAAGWVLRQDRGLTPAEQDAYLEWLTADPRHAAAYARHRRNWERLNLLAQWRPEHGAGPNRDLLAPPPATERRPRRARWWWAGLSLAAGLIVGLGWPWLARDRAEPLAVVAAEPVRVTLIRQETLADGSQVVLNRGARLRLAYDGSTRRVFLDEGEAHFTVQPDATRPFVVEAGGVEVRALGTAFNVRLGEADLEVLVTHGRVRVDDGTAEAMAELGAGQRVWVDLAESRPSVVAPVAAEEVERRLAWQPRLLDFSAQPLQAVVEEFNRRNAPYRIMVADSALAELPVSASLRSDNLEGFLRLLEAGFAVEVARTGHEIVLRPR